LLFFLALEVQRAIAHIREEKMVVPTALVERARERGEVDPSLDADLLLSTLAGGIHHRVFVRSEELSDAYLEALVDLLLAGVRPAPDPHPDGTLRTARRQTACVGSQPPSAGIGEAAPSASALDEACDRAQAVVRLDGRQQPHAGRVTKRRRLAARRRERAARRRRVGERAHPGDRLLDTRRELQGKTGLGPRCEARRHDERHRR
jgi:hypothetical protein